ncbi:MAG: C25 family cysteine peptidase [Thermoanaerobaculia bacterium]|jgi:hypothetical protein
MNLKRRSTIVYVISLLSIAMVVGAGNSGTADLMYPTGSGASIAFGDWVSTNAGAALDTHYSFFVEVPPNQSQLTIDIFDPDVLAGGAAAEAAAGRDRARTGAMTVGYSVRNPSGTVIATNFTTGSATTPTGGDNAWVTLLNYTGDFVLDQINATAFTGNNGTINWSSNWTEVGDNGNAGTGNVVFTGGDLNVNPPTGTALVGAQRTVNLSTFTNATLTFDAASNNTEGADQFQVQYSTNGGVSFTPLDTFSGAFTYAAQGPYTIPVGASTIIRFVRTASFTQAGETFEIDNVRVSDSDGAPIPNGHWEVRVDQSSAFTTSDDLNGFGIRAHDGDPSSAGIEYNVYADNMVSVGAHPGQLNIYEYFPWVTSGCQCGINDFDVDSNNTTTAAMALANRTGSFTQAFPDSTLSVDNTWNRDLTSVFTSPDNAIGYGIWTWGVNVPDYPGNGNYATVYLSSELTPANPPTANPVASSFRTYFATDVGAAPLKPYLEQLLTFKNVGGASNPPTAGQTPQYQVTVRLVNPTAWPITFSASNLVTANVPGGVVTYVGSSAQVSQGSIVSVPGGGGSGNITWNPGSVSAGATALLSYTIQVAYAGGTVNVTATPASGNGTRAQYLDETANTTQGRATNLVGPICQLSIGTLATDAIVASLDASKDQGRVSVIWTTSSELGAASFDLLRQEKSDWVKVNSVPIPALYTNGAGGSYAVDDPGANGGRQTWAIRETTIDGRTITHGSFSVVPRPPQASDPKADGAFGSKPNKATQSKPKPQAAANKSTSTALIAETTTRGIHSISASDVSAILGIPLGSVRAKFANAGFRLTRGGADVAWTPSPTGDSLLFFAEALDSPYTTRNAYQLTDGHGLTMQASPASPIFGGTTTYADTKWFETDAFAATAVPLDPEGDYWFQASFVPGYAGYTTRNFDIGVDGLASSSGASIAVKLQGATSAQHGAKLQINGVEVATSSWDAITPKTITAAVPQQLLHEGANSVTVEGVSNGSGPLSVFYVDSIGVTYQRATVPRNGQLELEATGPTTVSGLSSLSLLLDSTSASRPIAITGVTPDASGNVSWNATPGRRYALSTLGGVTPASARGSRANDLEGIRAADLLIITSAGLHDAAEAYAQGRRSTGLLVAVADVEAIYDAMSRGVETPHAIRAYLREASRWAVAPRYVLLAGRGSYDYKGIAGEEPIVPPLMVRSADGIFASDARLADVDGDRAPDMAIGRLPISDVGELLAYSSKIERLEGTQARFPALFASDDPDRGVVFSAASDRMQSALPFGSPLRISLGDTPLASARAQLFASWASGISIVNWTGHGGLDRLASEGLLTSADVASLASDTPPVLVALSCIINRFEIPNYPALGETLVLAESGGAAATFAPTGLAYHDASTALGDELYHAFSSDTTRLGDLVRAAAAKHPGDASQLYVLLGDPTLQLRMPTTIQGSRDGE